jgi:probable HAF family extracellular repeat protein
MKMTGNSRMQSLILATTLSIGLCFSSSASAEIFLLDSSGKVLSEFGMLHGYDGYDIASAYGINDAGQVAGWSLTASGQHAFITGPNGVGMTGLGTLGGGSSARSINDAGQVVGSSYIAGGASHAFITGPNGVGMTDLGTLGGDSSQAWSINDAGRVVGYSTTAAGSTHAFITGPNGVGMTDLGTLGGGYSIATDINGAGQVVGYSTTAAGKQHAFITGPNGAGMTDLGTLDGDRSSLDGDRSFAYGINDAGQVAGWSVTLGSHHGFITGPNGVGMTDLGTLDGGARGNSQAYDINDAGQVVGGSLTLGSHHGFITGPNGVGMTDLNSLASLPAGYVIGNAIGINNAGQVLVTAVTASIPEPETYALMLAGLGLIGFLAWRQKSGNRIQY